MEHVIYECKKVSFYNGLLLGGAIGFLVGTLVTRC